METSTFGGSPLRRRSTSADTRRSRAPTLCGRSTCAPTTSAIQFHTRSGVLTARRLEHGIELDFPTQPEVATQAPRDLVEALGVTPEYVGRNQTDYLVELASESLVREVQPDFRRLASVPMRGVMITAAGSSRAVSPRYDFVSRFFAPAVGVDEDPVTGSAHCCLGPFWQRRLGRDRLRGFPGVVAWRVCGSLGKERPGPPLGGGRDGLPR